MKIRICGLSLLISAAWGFLPQGLSAETAPLKIAATLPTFAAIAKVVGGERVEVSSVASPKFDPHFIEPRPSDVLKVKRCDLFLHGGLDLEAWRPALLDASARPEVRAGGARELDLSRGIPLLEVPTTALTRAQGDIHLFGNPHFWTSPPNALIIAENIAQKLSELDPTGADTYLRNLGRFRIEIDSLSSQWKESARAIKNPEVVAYHNEWLYLLEFLGLKAAGFIEPKPGVPPTPKHLASLSALIEQRKLRVIIQASYVPKDASNSLAKKTGAKVLVLCQSVAELEPCGSYTEMLSYNINSLLGALTSG